MTTVQNELVKLVADDRAGGDYFGHSVAFNGNYAIIGANQDDNYAGSAYIFELDANGNWTQKQKLTPSNAAASEQFGQSVAMSGNYAMVGVPYRTNEKGTSAGSVIIFELVDSNWTQSQELIASDGAASNFFGKSVAMSGDYAIIGTPQGNAGKGCAYIFERTNGSWTQKIRLKDFQGFSGDELGESVAISGNYAIIGAYTDDNEKGTDAGQAIIYERDTNGNWSEKIKLKASDGGNYQKFGWSVAISGDYAIVGAWGASNTYIFKRDANGTWTETQKLIVSNLSAGSKFGYCVAISGDYAVVGAIKDDNEYGTDRGSSYLFELDANGNWTEKNTLLPSNGSTFYGFGWSATISGNYIITGEPNERSNGSNYTGAAYVFQIAPAVPAEEQTLIDLNIETADIDVIKAVTFSNKVNGKGSADATSRAKMKSLLDGATDAADKRRKRRATLKIMFNADTDVTKMVIPKADLDLPTGFTKTNALVVKAGQTFAVSDLSADEGFYSVLDDGETISITTDNTTLTFTRQDVGDNELYTVSATT